MGMLINRHRNRQGASTPEPVEAPKASGKKAEWVAFALSTGASEDDIKGLTRDELCEQFTPEVEAPKEPETEVVPDNDDEQPEPDGEPVTEA